jgi:uncharacterized phage-associated protein
MQESFMLTAIQVADWIVRFRAEAAPVDPRSLQKLLFYAQAFHLARRGEPLFADPFEAWIFGPVVDDVWRKYRENAVPFVFPKAGDQVPSLDRALEDGLTDTVSFFSRWNSFVLSEATHNEDPWIDARRGFAPHERSSVPIPADRIRTYYAGLLWDGEEALSHQELLDDLPEPRIGSFYRAGICVRGMKRHPLYSPAWADALSRPVPLEPEFPEGLLEPLKRRSFVPARDL